MTDDKYSFSGYIHENSSFSLIYIKAIIVLPEKELSDAW